METLVVGAGPMGRWTGHLVREAVGTDLLFLDRDPETADEAATAAGGRALEPTELTDASEDSVGVVCVAVPIPAAAETLRRHGPRARKAVLDVTGTMADPVAAMRELSGPECVSLHPLFAPDSEPGNLPVVVQQGGPTVEAVLATLDGRGNRVFETTPAVHDRAMETTQARTHAAVLAFALAAEPVPERFHTNVSADLAALADRVTGGNPGVYGDIQAAFEGRADVAEAARRVAEADSVERIHREATDRREEQHSNSAGHGGEQE